jgi:hypothetical protein
MTLGVNLTTRDAAALLGAVGVKAGGGSWSRAFLFFVGAKIAMNYFNWPDGQVMSDGAQSLMQSAGEIVQRMFGTAPPESYYASPDVVSDTYSNTIDAEYQEVR